MSPAPPVPRRRARRRVRPAAGQPVWLFDLDNTLHHASHAIFPLINRAMTEYIVSTLGVDHAEANRLRTLYTQRYGATLLGLTRHHAIDAPAFLKQVHTFPELASLVRHERGLGQLLRTLPGRKLVLTNGPEEYARAVLRILGIERRFEAVIAIEQMRHRARWHAKPDAAMLRRAMRRERVALGDAVLVEDTRGHLKRYKRLGLRTVWMVGHLPGKPRTADSAASSVTASVTSSAAPPATPPIPPSVAPGAALAGSGRPHYVDRRVRSLRALRRPG